ncbi:hypothetical protein, partial [Klebsiella pneumoniae]|uniref:hypothetical protein n=1 Tax=Klebsiella pneumoniae TaxID=573 RepID=UPI0013D728CD
SNTSSIALAMGSGYFVVVNAIACAYAATSMAFPALNMGSSRRNWTCSSMLVSALDLLLLE